LDGGAGRFLFDKLVDGGGGGGCGAVDVSNDNAADADVVVGQDHGQDHAVRGERVSGRQGFGRNEARSCEKWPCASRGSRLSASSVIT
jgi:hypothetical protein